MSQRSVNTKNAPAPIGPYNQAVWAGNLLFISGQICLDPRTNQLNNRNLTEETKQVMENLGAILSEAGLSFDKVKQ